MKEKSWFRRMYGPAIGRAQRQMLGYVVDHPEDNTKERLREILAAMEHI